MREITRKINVQYNAHDKGGLSLGLPGNPRHERTMPLRQKAMPPRWKQISGAAGNWSSVAR
jgi:hypothetical protein